jgi:hypothetical protein
MTMSDPRKVANKQRRKAGREVYRAPLPTSFPLILTSVAQHHEERNWKSHKSTRPRRIPFRNYLYKIETGGK